MPLHTDITANHTCARTKVAPTEEKCGRSWKNMKRNQSDVMIAQFPGTFCSDLPVADCPGRVM